MLIYAYYIVTVSKLCVWNGKERNETRKKSKPNKTRMEFPMALCEFRKKTCQTAATFLELGLGFGDTFSDCPIHERNLLLSKGLLAAFFLRKCMPNPPKKKEPIIEPGKSNLRDKIRAQNRRAQEEEEWPGQLLVKFSSK